MQAGLDKVCHCTLGNTYWKTLWLQTRPSVQPPETGRLAFALGGAMSTASVGFYFFLDKQVSYFQQKIRRF